MKRLLAEPLVHFLILGAALFGVYALIRSKPTTDSEQIVVTASRIENLTTTFTRVWQRPPTARELKGLIDDYVKEEILSREAIKLKLDQDDTIVRRRLRQKMEFLAEDFAATREPTDAELATYLLEHADAFREPPRFTFRHIFLSDERGARLKSDADGLLAQLKQDPALDPTSLGDRFLGPAEFKGESLQGVASQLGGEFAEQLNGVAVGQWTGPVRSTYGAHLVLVTHRENGRQPTLAEARERVKRELLAGRRQQANQAFLDALLVKYEVRIEGPTGTN